MTSEIRRLVSNLASVGMVRHDPSPRDVQLAALNEALAGRQAYPVDPTHDHNVTLLLQELGIKDLHALLDAVSDLDDAVGAEILLREENRG